jgi:hypothetical protein
MVRIRGRGSTGCPRARLYRGTSVNRELLEQPGRINVVVIAYSEFPLFGKEEGNVLACRAVDSGALNNVKVAQKRQDRLPDILVAKDVFGERLPD